MSRSIWTARKQGFGFACIDCGISESGVTLQKGHAHPRSRGGTDHMANIIPQCGPCNSTQASRIHGSHVCVPGITCSGMTDSGVVGDFLSVEATELLRKTRRDAWRSGTEVRHALGEPGEVRRTEDVVCADGTIITFIWPYETE